MWDGQTYVPAQRLMGVMGVMGGWATLSDSPGGFRFSFLHDVWTMYLLIRQYFSIFLLIVGHDERFSDDGNAIMLCKSFLYYSTVLYIQYRQYCISTYMPVHVQIK
jgi:hypothetical protein